MNGNLLKKRLCSIVLAVIMVLSLSVISNFKSYAYEYINISTINVGDTLVNTGVSGNKFKNDTGDTIYLFYEDGGGKCFFSTDTTPVTGLEICPINNGDNCPIAYNYYVIRDPRLPEENSDENDDKNDDGSNDDDSRPAPPSPHEVAQNRILHELDNQLAHIDPASDGQVIIDGGDLVNALPNGTMVKIAENRNATIFFKFIYNDVHYTTAIPAGAAIDTSLDYYGPLYMMNVFPTMYETESGSVPYVPGA